ncbi:transcription factor IIF subunit tfg1 [Coemansia sp. RSA 1813]|nr:transcription factor IIF subunit tfg1 [Coemansia sp. RSA 1646]KAJ1772963.1 transcription factor IIF subunit tfg1 [Coemansia sp. RSA 1843]KAJ2093540.1 transcription factor IIF subunit tfg1 [Coemansia sp. RSA 986]KAJ2210737.1 transcription factor IIF subunit tfg1 [Coemansia sp. RSA 487]KAJ2563519.1 transcription factor IIF subunit tfg1 [Coemansia sp. RSA 1813]
MSSLGSAGIRNIGVRPQTGSSGVGRRLAPGARRTAAPPRGPQQQKAPTDADIPLAAATGVANPQDTRSCIEYPLMSATPQSTHNVMRFLEANPVNLRELTQPVKLRRRNREYYRLKNKKRNEERAALLAAKTATDLKIEDGKAKPVDGGGQNDQPATADAAGVGASTAAGGGSAQQANDQQQQQRPKADMSLIADMGGARRNKKNLFKKRTKQVYFADEEKRRLDIEEARPWVLEDDDEKDVWTGSLEGAQNSAYVLFVLTDDGFKVVPVDRWYKFTPKLKYKTLTLDEAEEVLKSEQKIDSRSRWIMRKHMQQKEDEEGGKEKEASSSSRPAKKPSLVEYEAMDEDDDLFADDDESSAKRKKRGTGKNGDFDEVNFEMEFDDDEELGDVQFEYNEEESREKDEQKRKNHATGFGSGDEDEDEGDGADARNDLDDDGKTIKKLIRKREDGKEYESDDDNENPYLSLSEIDSDESDSDEDSVKKEGDNASKGAEASDGAQKSPSPSPSTASTAGAPLPSSSKKRKRISVGGPQARGSGSPLSAASDSHERIKHAKSSHQLAKAQSGGSASKGSSGASGSSPDLITRREIIDLIKSGVNTTKDLIGCVRKKLKANPENKKRIQLIVKDVAILKNDRLALKTTAV